MRETVYQIENVSSETNHWRNDYAWVVRDSLNGATLSRHRTRRDAQKAVSRYVSVDKRRERNAW